VLGAGGLGRYIVDGIAVRDFPRVIGGALLVAALALLVEGLLALAQRAATPKGVRLARRPT
jgi:osmoprotectant transport system permease protein